MTLAEYVSKINARFRTGIATEHTYRGDLQGLIESLAAGMLVTNEPQRVACGAPDYIVTKKNIPVGYIEAKDIDADLDNKQYKEQFDRYKASLPNLIITDYLQFRLFREGELKMSVRIARSDGKNIVAVPEGFAEFDAMISDFLSHQGQTIKSAQKLARMMAGKAKLMALAIEKALTIEETSSQVNEQANLNLKEQMNTFKEVLIHDITPKSFADIYSQTIAYGMFAARLHDPHLDTFSRQEAAELIPKTNPFLRKLFQYVAGYDLDDRIKWIVDDLADIFRATNISELLADFGRSTQQRDPVIHFYETFLSEYDPALRKSRGVWYTPQPVVNFIVRAVDDILKTEFGLKDGLADSSKIKIKTPVQGVKNLVEQEVLKVQLLDPACGTGTFLSEVVRQIYTKFEGQQGIWSQYVDDHLIPRLNGFELLMASYAMAHLKLDMLLAETGYKSSYDQRFKIFLTNSLEEYHKDTGTLFAGWLSSEANEANKIKRDTPVMVVLGNPPYSGISSNNGEWISNLIEDYKYVDGVHFNERKHWLNDDYVKFIRFGQHFIAKNGSGVLAFINPHGFLDNPTFRGMRWNLLKTYDKIYTIDLHGNSTKKETALDGSIDQNVFDIMQGVAITVFVKTGKKKANELGKIYHYDLFGKREFKYDFLHNNSLRSIKFQCLKPEKPNLFFVPKNDLQMSAYNQGFGLIELFKINSMGFVTANDNLNISFSKSEVQTKISELLNLDEIKWRLKYCRLHDARDWTYKTAKNDALENSDESKLQQVSYRPFDTRYTLYTGNSRGLYSSPQPKITSHVLNRENFNFICVRLGRNVEFHNYFLTKTITDKSVISSLDNANVFPLYLYPETTTQQSIGQAPERTPNLKAEIVNQIAEKLGMQFVNEKDASTGSASAGTFSPIDLLDYIYAVLHSPSYREKYKEFLKIDFPRVPYPENKETFWQLVSLGGELRQIHLLESEVVERCITTYPVGGTNTVDKIRFDNGKVFISDEQYFDKVPEAAWNFYIGGYQPAQKWLKDRKGRTLTIDDIRHYQKIIVALHETERIMGEIDRITINY
ncbi:MAG: type ISP restriction/modification enzyme [Bacteroidota bacterium]